MIINAQESVFWRYTVLVGRAPQDLAADFEGKGYGVKGCTN